jgi:HEAT repeat protein
MKQPILLAALLVLGSASLLELTSAHGGSYRGPGDTVPPGGTGGTGGTGTTPGVPTPTGSTTGTPTGPIQPAPPGVPTGTTGRTPVGVTTITPGFGPDLTTWEFWWGFNKDQYLNLKAHVHGGGVVTDADAFFDRRDRPRDTLRPSEETIRTKIVPALKQALETERGNDIVTGALVALAKIGDVRREDGTSEFEPLLARFLADPTQEIAETSAVALGILASEASIGKLEELVLDTPAGRKLVGTTEVRYRTRAFAAYGLGLIGASTGRNEVRQQIARILIGLLQRPDTSTRDVKVAALVALGLVPVDIDPSEAPEGSIDHAASRQAQIQFVRRFYQDQGNHYLVRAHAPTAMARLIEGAPADVREGVAKLLLQALDKNSKERDEVRQSCVLSLGMLGDTDQDKTDQEIRAALVRMADEGDIQSRNFACIALAQIGGRPGHGGGDEQGRGECRQFLLEQLTKGRSHMKPWAGVAIGVLENALARAEVPAGTASATLKAELRRALADAVSPEQVSAWSIGLGIAGDAEARAVLLRKLQEMSESNARGYVAIGLGLIDAREAIEPIQKVVQASQYRPDLLKSAAIGLGLLGDKALVPELCRMLSAAKGLSAQAAIASALGFIGDSRSVDPLVEMLQRKQDLTDGARGFAAVALGIVADKEPLPWNAKISTNVNYRASTPTLTGENGTGILDIL